MDDQKTIEHVDALVKTCLDYLGDQSAGRELAMDYFRGKMPDMPVAVDEDNTPVSSTVVSADVRAIVKKILPSMLRTILGGDQVVEFEPKKPGGEEAAQQASEYVNFVVIPESDAEKGIYDAIHDALLLKTGILKWTAYTTQKAVVQEYSDQGDDDIIGLFDDPAIEVLEHETSEESNPEVLALDPNARRHSFKIKRIDEQTDIKLEGVPRGSFLISPGAESIEEAELVGEEQKTTRSALVAMGYDRKKVWTLDEINANDQDDDQRARMGDDWTGDRADSRKATQDVLIYEVYAKLDSDDDGIAEVHKIVYGKSGGDENEGDEIVVLGSEIVTEAPYAEVVCERDPYQFEGHSIFEDIAPIQRVKTALLRETLNNLYQQNNPIPAVDWGAIENPDAVMGRTGEPIAIKSGRDIDQVLQWHLTPFVADKSYSMLGYMDDQAKDRTGITDASGGLSADMMQNVNNGVAELVSESGLAQAAEMVRTISRGGLRKAFKGLLKLVIAHTDQPRTVRLRGEWHDYDPRAWDADMDCVVNIGLGGGTKERDMTMLQIVYGMQKEIAMTLGADNPYVKPDQLYNTMQKITETAGFPSADPYFTEPDMDEVKAKMQQAASQPSPEEQKLQAEMQLEQMKMQSNTAKEQAQMEADLTVKQAEIEAKTIENREKLALQRDQDAQAERLELARMEQDRDLKLADIQAKLAIAGAQQQARQQS
mgnify:CR=1 FL=1